MLTVLNGVTAAILTMHRSHCLVPTQKGENGRWRDQGTQPRNNCRSGPWTLYDDVCTKHPCGGGARARIRLWLPGIRAERSSDDDRDEDRCRDLVLDDLLRDVGDEPVTSMW